MTDVEPRFNEKVECPCDVDTCTVFGKPRRNGHVRGCVCLSCANGRNSRQGKARHRKFARDTGLRTAKNATSAEEAWRDPFRWEIKTGKQVDPILTRFELAKAQSEQDRPVGDVRPFAMGAVPSSSRRPAVVIVDAKDWQRHIVPLLREYGDFR